MRGVVFLGDRQIEVREFPDPEPGPREVVLEIKASGMCGSDLKLYRNTWTSGAVSGGIKRSDVPVIAGHEPCGIVVAVGSAVTPQEAHIGQRVMDHHYEGCGTCKHCSAGWAQMCLDGAIVFGSGGNGGHANYMKVPVSSLVPLPNAFTIESRSRSQNVLNSSCSSGELKSKSAISTARLRLKASQTNTPEPMATMAKRQLQIGTTTSDKGVW